jgi:hypothetical protein
MRHATSGRLIVLAVLGAIVLAMSSAAADFSLSATPNPAFVGQPVAITARPSPGTPVGQLLLDFGDGSQRAAVQANVPVYHAYAQAGQYVLVLYSSGAIVQVVARLRLTVVAPSTPTPAPAASRGLAVTSIALSWPNGQTSLSLSGSAPPPRPVAVVQTSGSGTLVVQWQLDGNPIQTATQSVAAGGAQRLTLSLPLPASGQHSVSLAVLSPSYLTGATATPPPPIAYAYAAGVQTATGYYSGPVPVVKFPHLSLTFTEGMIDLLTPQWGKQECGEGFTCDYGTPMLDDSAVFSWHERNPGTADYFELRILSPEGTLLVAKRLDRTQTYYAPDPAFLQSVLQKLYSWQRMHRRVVADAGQVVADVVRAGGPATNTSNGPALRYLRAANLLWEVRGYKQVAENPNQPAQTKTVEVEKSAQWPLGKPDNANGLGACPVQSGGLQQLNLALQGTQQGTNTINYVGDPIAVYGNLDLSGSPYLSHPNVRTDADQDTLAPPMREVDFDNVLIDWGDGSIDYLRAVPAQPTNGSFYGQRQPSATALQLPTALTPIDVNASSIPGTYGTPVNMHRYQAVGRYKIRIFQVAESDIQNLSLSGLAAYVDGTTLAAVNPYFRLVSVSAVAGSDPKPAPIRFTGALRQTPANPADVAARAYQLFCDEVTIDEGADAAAEGPLNLQSVAITDFPNHRVSAPDTAMAAGSVYGVCSTCDDDLTAQATLRYYGTGDAQATWLLDGQQLETDALPGLSSHPRHGCGRGGCTGAPIVDSQVFYPRQTLTTQQGHHRVVVEVEVAPPTASSPNLDLLVAAGRVSPATLGGTVGFLSPLSQGSPHAPLVAYVAPNASHLVIASSGGLTVAQAPLTEPPRRPGGAVTSGPAFYDAQPANPKMPCKFLFATKEGTFEISGLQHNVKSTGSGLWSGHGSLVLRFPVSSGASEAIPVRVNFQNWYVPDGLNVAQARLHVGSPPEAQNLHLIGVTASVASVDGQTDGKPDYDMVMGLNLSLTSQELRIITNPPHTPAWNNLVAPVAPDGTWVYKNAVLPATEIGHSQFFLASNNVTFDLTKNVKNVDLGQAQLTLFTLGFGQSTVQVGGWYVDAEGLEGSFDRDINFRTDIENGYLSIPHATVNVTKSELTATYPGMQVFVPLINTTVSGDGSMDSSGTFSMSRNGYPSTVSVSFGQIAMDVTNIGFRAQQGLGWGLGCQATLHFSNGPSRFADVPVNDMFLTFGGNMLFSGGATAVTVPLGGSSMFGNTPVQLQSVHLSAGSGTGDVLDAAFAATVHLSSSSYMPAAPTQINYSLVRQGTQYAAAPPSMNRFDEEVAFPAGQPASDSHIRPVYRQTANDDQYTGDVDLSNFGGPPVKAQFLLGYQGGTDYWAIRADLSFPGTGVVIIPAAMSLYRIGGGAGYHIHLKNPEDVKNATFDPSSDLTLLAGLQLGSVDKGFTYFLDGNFTITLGNSPSVRMDYAAWFASPDHSGNPAIDGYFQFGGGNFDGGLEGKFDAPDPLNNIAYLEIPGPRYGSSQYAASLHFGGGDWHIYVGQKSGPRVQAHLLVGDVDGYLMLSNQGVDVGGSATMNLDVGDSSVVSAYIDFEGDVDLTITPEPHLTGEFSETAQCGACIAGGCFSVSESVDIKASAMPLDVTGCASISTPWPLPDIHFCVHL